eukprot:scaffold62680_cov53-Phaeocystis_antarctica.AAC.4
MEPLACAYTARPTSHAHGAGGGEGGGEGGGGGGGGGGGLRAEHPCTARRVAGPHEPVTEAGPEVEVLGAARLLVHGSPVIPSTYLRVLPSPAPLGAESTASEGDADGVARARRVAVDIPAAGISTAGIPSVCAREVCAVSLLVEEAVRVAEAFIVAL